MKSTCCRKFSGVVGLYVTLTPTVVFLVALG